MRANPARGDADLHGGLADASETPGGFTTRLREAGAAFRRDSAGLAELPARHRARIDGARRTRVNQAAGAAVTILLSTYNGEKFLPDQLASFADQDFGDWRLLWRDDGSTDQTVAMMRNFAATLPEGVCVESATSGPHLGAAPSFLLLLREARTDRIIAFADQDDVWLPTKLQRAVAHIAAAGDRPALYCAQQYMVDEALRGLKKSAAFTNPPGFPASLTQNIANGNTLVMNRAACDLVSAIPGPEGTVHDWWSYIVVSACGGLVMFDADPQILYRLHKNNLIAASPSITARALAALDRGPGIFMTMMRRHADTLNRHAARLTPSARADLAVVQEGLNGTWRDRLQALKNTRFRRRTLLENMLFAYWFLTG
jgi:glycosyltransferase involved in cell wall biosynthesis